MVAKSGWGKNVELTPEQIEKLVANAVKAAMSQVLGKPNVEQDAEEEAAPAKNVTAMMPDEIIQKGDGAKRVWKRLASDERLVVFKYSWVAADGSGRDALVLGVDKEHPLTNRERSLLAYLMRARIWKTSGGKYFFVPLKRLEEYAKKPEDARRAVLSPEPINYEILAADFVGIEGINGRTYYQLHHPDVGRSWVERIIDLAFKKLAEYPKASWKEVAEEWNWEESQWLTFIPASRQVDEPKPNAVRAAEDMHDLRRKPGKRALAEDVKPKAEAKGKAKRPNFGQIS